MDINDLNLSEPLADITSDRAVRLGDMYDDFSKHCAGGMERHEEPVPAAV